MARYATLGRFRVVALTTIMAAGLVGYTAARPQQPPRREYRPFVAEIHVLHTPGPQRTPMSEDVLYARRANGSHVTYRQATSPDGEKGTMVQIHDMEANRQITLHPFVMASSTFYYTPAVMREWLSRGQETCASPETAAMLRNKDGAVTDLLLGRQVRRVVSQDPKDGQRIEAWVAEDLDCFALQKTIARPSGAVQQSTVSKLTEGDPPDSLFDVSPEYGEMSPLGLEAAYAAKFPGHSLFGKMLDLLQQRYEAALLDKP